MNKVLKAGDIFNVSETENTYGAKLVKNKLYVVISTRMTGGGCGHGPHDVYPDGHEVTAVQFDPKTFAMSKDAARFYQSGCFTCVLSPKLVTHRGTAKLRPVIVVDSVTLND